MFALSLNNDQAIVYSLVAIFPIQKSYTKNKNEINMEVNVQRLTENYKRDSSVIVLKFTDFLSLSVPFNKTRQMLQFQKTDAVGQACKYHKLLKISLILDLNSKFLPEFSKLGSTRPIEKLKGGHEGEK